MEVKPLEGSAQVLRGQRMQGDCGCSARGEVVPGERPVEMPMPSERHAREAKETVNLTEREMLIYQAGQCFGAASALRQVAKTVNDLSQKINCQAGAQQAEGQKLLDRALTKELTPGAKAGVKLANRVLKAFGALVGE